MKRNRFRRRGKDGQEQMPKLSNSQDLWDMEGFKDTTKHFKMFEHNLDFSGFPALIEASYKQMWHLNYTIEADLPFCVYQHSCFCRLNAHLINYLREEHFRSGLDGLRMYPGQYFHPYIYEYLQAIGNCTDQGFDVKMNLPEDAIPKPALNNGDQQVEPGTFGVIDAQTHNLYECFASPYISKALILKVIEFKDGDPQEWSPLPDWMYPAGAKFTRNCLGYQEDLWILKANSDKLKNIRFSTDERSRLCISLEVEDMVNNYLRINSHKIQIKEGFPPFKCNNALNIITTYAKPQTDSTRIGDLVSELNSCYKNHPENNWKASLYSLRRQRTAEAPGLCIIPRDKDQREAFLATINHNFESKSIYKNEGYSHPRSEPKLWQSLPIYENRFTQFAQQSEHYSQFYTSRPLANVYVHNLDFSGFAAVIEASYKHMKQKMYTDCSSSDDDDVNFTIENIMPFCVYQHSCFSRLNAYLIHYVQHEYPDSSDWNEGHPYRFFRLQASFHPAVYEYLQAIGNCRTELGDVKINIPKDALPKPSLTNGDHKVDPGTFGIIDANTHNLYECYASPYISKALVLQLKQFENGDPKDWNPLPDWMFPAGLKFTRNCLGYQRCTQLDARVKNKLQNIQFSTEDDLSGRICFSREIEDMVNGFLMYYMGHKMTVKNGFPPLQLNNSLTIFANVTSHTEVLWERNESLCCYIKQTAANYCRACLFNLKRMRTKKAPGLCIIPPDDQKEEFLSTINDNFELASIFEVVSPSHKDLPILRYERFIEYPDTYDYEFPYCLLLKWCEKFNKT